MLRQGVQLQSLKIHVRLAAPPPAVARFFNLDQNHVAGTPRKCLRLVRLKGEAGEPIVEFRSRLHPRLNLTVDDDFAQPLYELIEQRAH
jgi:GntR family transcriptional regulator